MLARVSGCTACGGACVFAPQGGKSAPRHRLRAAVMTLMHGAALDGARRRRVSAILSLLAPGAGQVFRRERVVGLLWFFAVAAAYRSLMPLGFLIHALCVINAAEAGSARGELGKPHGFVVWADLAPKRTDLAIPVYLAFIIGGLMLLGQINAGQILAGTRKAAGSIALMQREQKAAKAKPAGAPESTLLQGAMILPQSASVTETVRVTNVAANLIYTGNGRIFRLARTVPVKGAREHEARYALWTLVGGKELKVTYDKRLANPVNAEMSLADGRNVSEEAAKARGVFLVEAPRPDAGSAAARSLEEFAVRVAPVTEDGVYYTIAGHATNRTQQVLDRIWLRITALDGNGNVVDTETTASSGPVRPGRSAPFRFIGRKADVPGAVKWQIVATGKLW